MADIKEIGLSNSLDTTIIDAKDYPSVKDYSWRLSNSGYVVSGSGSSFSMHRLLNKTPEDMFTDHINRNRLDNRKSNLRTCTHAENMANITPSYLRKKKGSISKNGKYWQARIQIAKYRHFIGSFTTKKEALLAIEQYFN